MVHVEYVSYELYIITAFVTQVQTSAVQSLSSADIDDVPVIVRFLLQTVTSADAQMVHF